MKSIILRDHEHGASLIVRPLTRLLRFGRITEFGESTTNGYDWHFRDKEMRWHDLRAAELTKYLPFAPGDVLVGKETWAMCASLEQDDGFIAYKIEGKPPSCSCGRWRSPATMPQWASRWRRVVTDVAVKRLNEITEWDARQMGAEYHDGRGIGHSGWRFDKKDVHANRLSAYARHWNAANPKLPWSGNPWIVAVSVQEAD